MNHFVVLFLFNSFMMITKNEDNREIGFVNTSMTYPFNNVFVKVLKLSFVVI